MFFKRNSADIGLTKLCEDQLRDDFGHFPPGNLRCSTSGEKFKTVKYSALKKRRRALSQIFSYSVFGKKPMICAYSGHVDYLWTSNLNNMKEKFGHSKKIFYGMSFIEKIFSAVLLFIFSPLILPALIVFLIYKVIKPTENESKEDVYGSISPIEADFWKRIGEVIINPAGLKLDVDCINAIVTHEHIHYLQFLDTVYSGRDSFRCKVVNPNLLFDKENKHKEHLGNYWFSEREVEARLHEIILMHYRKNNYLPSTIQDLKKAFLKSSSFLISDCPSKTPAIKRWLRRIEGKNDHSGFRSITICTDISLMCAEFKDAETGLRYLNEVLPIFYSRLLKYYGDPEASREFSNQIFRPNFYDQLYCDFAK